MDINDNSLQIIKKYVIIHHGLRHLKIAHYGQNFETVIQTC